MANFANHTIESAPSASKALLEGAKQKVGFVPNLYAGMAEAPALLEGYLAISGIFDKTSFSPTERQIVLMTSNRLNGCSYCMAAHTSISQMSGVPEGVVTALRNNTPIADGKLEALRQFAIVVVESRGWPSEEHVDAFLDAGYTKQNILEVILGTAMKVMSNYTNHIVNTPIDAAFKPNAWSGELAEVA
ncbi:MAG: putative peroxidase-related enzyme [Mariniblastus sp.]|jgi:uncharacterized peroxidase-related enzyme